jgi:hypothetical protein
MPARRNMKKPIKKSMKKTIKRSNNLRGAGQARTKGNKQMKRSKVKKTIKKSTKGIGWLKALSMARKQLGLKGFITINKGKDGTALYKKAKELQGK